ncbi:hypothetical protein, partial [Streptomyces natalensis]
TGDPYAVPQEAAQVGDPYAAVPQQQPYEQWQAAPVQPDGQPYAPADPYQGGQGDYQAGQAAPYGGQPGYPHQDPGAYPADPYQAGAYDPYGYAQQAPQTQQPYDDGTTYPGSFPEPRRDGSDQQ